LADQFKAHRSQLGDDADQFLVLLQKLIDGDHPRPSEEARRCVTHYRDHHAPADLSLIRAHLRDEFDQLEPPTGQRIVPSEQIPALARRLAVIQVALEGLDLQPGGLRLPEASIPEVQRLTWIPME